MAAFGRAVGLAFKRAPKGVTVVWRAGFLGGIIPPATALSTVVADFVAHASMGTVTYTKASDPAALFTVTGSTLVLSAAIAARQIAAFAVTGTGTLKTKTVATSAYGAGSPVIQSAPTIAGTPRVGQTLSASTGSWLAFPDPTGYAYVWKADGVAIGGAIAASYLLTNAEAGKVITVEVTATNPIGTSAAAPSSATTAVTSAPAITSVTLSSYAPNVGDVLSVAIVATGYPAPTPTYVWRADGTIVGTAATYTAVSGDAGKTITCTVTETNTVSSASLTATATSPVSAALVVNGFVVDGDSIANGVATELATRSGKTVTSRAVAGEQLIVNMEPNFATDVAPYYNASTGNVLYLYAGTNDFGVSDATVAAVQTALQSYCAKARTAGFKIALATILPRSDAAWNAGKETKRLAYNTWLRANYSTFADCLVDLAVVPELQTPTDTDWYSDGLHPVSFGVELEAITIDQATGITATPANPPGATAFSTTPRTGTAVFINNNRTVWPKVTNTGFASNVAISGKKVFAATMDTRPGHYGLLGVGVAVGTAPPGTETGNKSIAAHSFGGVFFNDSTAASGFAVWNAGDVIGGVVDETNGKFWFTKDGIDYYGTTGPLTKAQVEAGTSGLDLTAIKANGPLYALVGGTSAVIRWTLQTTYPWTIPTGYTQL